MTAAESVDLNTLPAPAFYFPPVNGRYEVKPGLAVFGTDFGNGMADRRVFQIDRRFDRYRSVIEAARRERLSKYYRTRRLGTAAEPIVRFVVTRLNHEYPELFTLTSHRRRGWRLKCRLTGEALEFDHELQLHDSNLGPMPPYADALDALAAQVPEDIAVVRRASGREWLAALHLCAPNYWGVEEKIGRDFVGLHEPVAGIEPINRKAEAMVTAMIEKGPYVRFVWGLTTDEHLNHHPEPAPGHDPAQWHGRRFDPDDPQLFLRVERQTTRGLPEADAALFTIRTYVTDCRTLTPEQRARLASAVRSMTPEQLGYKGLADSHEAVAEWLERA
ncbi:MAG: DUF3445 domain-containing protein [Gammaproteobacteria bacterium]|nr:DUF3445 domain-containing protein [Gammaproteobacteria bacterium]